MKQKPDIAEKFRALEAGNQACARIIAADPERYPADGLMGEWARRIALELPNPLETFDSGIRLR